MFIILVSTRSSAQEFSSFVGKNVAYLINQKGRADLEKENKSMTIYNYNINENENQTFSVVNSKVIMALNTIRSYSIAKAKNISSIKILHYMSLGFTKQGSEAGMTILKKGKRVLSIGYMNNDDGTYSTIVSAS